MFPRPLPNYSSHLIITKLECRNTCWLLLLRGHQVTLVLDPQIMDLVSVTGAIDMIQTSVRERRHIGPSDNKTYLQFFTADVPVPDPAKPPISSQNTSSSLATTSTYSSATNIKPVGKPASTISLEEFKRRREQTRSSFFVKKPKRKINQEVKVQIGMVHVVDGRFRRMKGRTLPVVIHEDATISELLQTAIAKHSKHFQQFNPSCTYVLMYADNKIVDKLPGSTEDFKLKAYKEDIGKPYAKIHFFLCKQEDYANCHDD